MCVLLMPVTQTGKHWRR